MLQLVLKWLHKYKQAAAVATQATGESIAGTHFNMSYNRMIV